MLGLSANYIHDFILLVDEKFIRHWLSAFPRGMFEIILTFMLPVLQRRFEMGLCAYSILLDHAGSMLNPDYRQPDVKTSYIGQDFSSLAFGLAFNLFHGDGKLISVSLWQF